jgi:hypothetical protein
MYQTFEFNLKVKNSILNLCPFALSLFPDDVIVFIFLSFVLQVVGVKPSFVLAMLSV